MSKHNKPIATPWFERAEEDLKVARHLLAEKFGHLTAASLLQQAAERYLKGYLLTTGWSLKKTHDLEQLITEAISRDADFSPFLEICRRLTEYYIETRYPPIMMSDLTSEEIKTSLDESEQLIALIIRKTTSVT